MINRLIGTNSYKEISDTIKTIDQVVLPMLNNKSMDLNVPFVMSVLKPYLTKGIRQQFLEHAESKNRVEARELMINQVLMVKSCLYMIRNYNRKLRIFPPLPPVQK